MPEESLPRLTELAIQQLATPQSFERGMNYYEAGAILNPVRQGRELRAECQGSRYEPYRVSVTLSQDGIASTHCTCPYDWGGICKHIVALLLTYVHEPESFHTLPSIDELLAGRSREELITIIRRMLQREPDLISVLELIPERGTGISVNTETYRRQARRAMQQSYPEGIVSGLQALREFGADREAAGDWLSAGAIYHVLLDEAVAGYTDLVHEMDYDGDLCVEIEEIAQGLERCLEEGSPDDETRRAWLETLLQVELRDTEIGGIDLAPSAWEAVLTHATQADWTWIEERLRAAIDQSSEWGREHLISRLVEGYTQRGDETAATTLIREMGTPTQKAHLLVREGQIEEAMRLMRELLQEKPGLLTNFADALVEAGADEEAVRLVTEHVQSDPHFWGADWLVRYYQEHGMPEKALDWRWQIFLENPSLAGFQALRELGRQVGRWEQVRTEALEMLQQERQIGLLIGIAVEEKDATQALRWLSMASGVTRHYQESVAEIVAQEYPREALRLYEDLVERAIAERQRKSYRQAAVYLRHVKEIYERLGAFDEWEQTIQRLRSEYARLPAFQDELRKAGL